MYVSSFNIFSYPSSFFSHRPDEHSRPAHDVVIHRLDVAPLQLVLPELRQLLYAGAAGGGGGWGQGETDVTIRFHKKMRTKCTVVLHEYIHVYLPIPTPPGDKSPKHMALLLTRSHTLYYSTT